MKLFTLFTYNVEIQYKSYLLSKAMFFILLTNGLIIILPFVFAYGGRGFWLKSQSYFEQPVVHFTYDYLLVAETDDPSQPIVCGNDNYDHDEYCAEFQVDEHDNNGDGTNDVLELKFLLQIPQVKPLASIVLLLGLDFQLKTVCPLHMQGLAIITKEFSLPPSAFIYYGDLTLHQASHLPCRPNTIDTIYNTSLFRYLEKKDKDVVNAILEDYFIREAIIDTKTLHSRSQNGHTGTMNIKIRLRIPENLVLYTPSLLQEVKWAWPQYLSMAVVFYWIFNRIKKFVFSNRLLMAWEVVTWKKL
ncbi:transmembrane protein 231 isoform X1 [Cydia amplana]|uniref:transmembrane protein 231 isoform X1 n=1 Tax=Cydia amplana TaxID=1869771 RepID=UPI002FE5CD59